MKTILFACLLICFSAHSQGDCKIQDPSTESIPEYLNKVADVLVALKLQHNEYDKYKKKKDKSDADAMVTFKEMKNAYQCASELIGSYKDSKNIKIAESSTLFSNSLNTFALTFEEYINEFKAELNGKETPPGERADKDSERIIASKKQWENVAKAIDIGTSAKDEVIDPATKQSRFFFIKPVERDSIVKKLKSQFRLPLKNGGDTAIDQVAGYFYDYLINVKYSK